MSKKKIVFFIVLGFSVVLISNLVILYGLHPWSKMEEKIPARVTAETVATWMSNDEGGLTTAVRNVAPSGVNVINQLLPGLTTIPMKDPVTGVEWDDDEAKKLYGLKMLRDALMGAGAKTETKAADSSDASEKPKEKEEAKKNEPTKGKPQSAIEKLRQRRSAR